jgi:hypothetical protein
VALGADLALSVSFGPGAGSGEGDVTLIASNGGPQHATGISLQASITGATLLFVDSVGVDCSDSVTSGTEVICRVDSLEPGSVVEAHFVFLFDTGVSEATTNALVTASEDDPDPTNNARIESLALR